MPKRSKKDIKSISVEHPGGESVFDNTASVPPLSIDGLSEAGRAAKGIKPPKKSPLKKVIKSELTGSEDPELEGLLLQVDRMLTEMTQSKWLSSDWPASDRPSTQIKK